MSERLLDYDPTSGLKTWFSSSEEDGETWGLRYEQTVDPVLDINKEQQAENFERKGDMWHAARVPIGILYEWMTKHGVRAWDKNHANGVKRLLNDPEYRYLRCNHFIM